MGIAFNITCHAKASSIVILRCRLAYIYIVPHSLQVCAWLSGAELVTSQPMLLITGILTLIKLILDLGGNNIILRPFIYKVAP